MTKKIIKDFSVSNKNFELRFDTKYKMYQTVFEDWKNISDYYQSENYISHTDGQRNWFEKIYQIVKQYTLKTKCHLINQFQKNTLLKVLDIGCGTGDFLKLGTQKFGWNGVGVEPNSTARQKAKDKNLAVEDNLSQLADKKFEVITLWHVLEHVRDLDEYFSFFQNHLTDDGLLVIAVPNYQSYDAKHYQQFWAAWDVPRHHWHFSKESIKLLAKDFGFECVKTQPMYFDSYYVSLLSEEYKTGRKNILKAFAIGFWSNLTAKSSKEYSSHIYLLKKSI